MSIYFYFLPAMLSYNVIKHWEVIMDIKKIIANNIYILRTTNDLTQKEFADKLEIKFTRGHISKIESGGHVPSAEFIKAVSNAFNVSADWLIDTKIGRAHV